MSKGVVINDLGVEEIEEEKFRRPFSRKKNLEGLPPGKKERKKEHL